MSTDSAPERYRRRSRWPALVIIAVLAIVTTVTWIAVLQPEPVVSNACNQPGPDPDLTSTSGSGIGDSAASSAAVATTSADPVGTETSGVTTADTASQTSAEATTPSIVTSLGTITDKNTMVSARPANPATVKLTVFNAGAINGLAKTVTEQFRKAGFASISKALSDPLYPAADLRCYGEIRYGDAGLLAARTVLIGAPCATLVKDNRFDDSVDLSLGALYEQREFSQESLAQLQQAINESKPPNVIEGQTAAPVSLAPIPPLPTATCPT